MEAKEYLRQIERLDTVIDQKLKELKDLKAKSTSIGSFDYSKERVQSTPSQEAPFVKAINRIVDLCYEINREIYEFVDKKHLIINQIQGLENHKYVEILYERYVEFKTLKQISVEKNYSDQYINLLHGRALKEFSRKYSIYFQ